MAPCGFFSLVLGIHISIVISDHVVSVKSNAVTFLESHRNDEIRVLDHRRWRRGITRQESEEITTLHNNLRSQEGASNMEYMKWNEGLSILAQQWADKCNYSHGQPSYDSSIFPYTRIGQNLFTTNGTFTFATAINNWYAEIKFFTYESGEDYVLKSGHYTQVVWAQSYEVGCAYTRCSVLWNSTGHIPNATFFVCNYGPAGNNDGLTPFKKGTACSYCETRTAWCTQGLCNRDCQKASPICECKVSSQRCKTWNETTCSCSCEAGWLGSDCSVECKNTDKRCCPHSWESGWPPAWCNNNDMGSIVRLECPAMCGLCQVANGTDFVACGGSGAQQEQRTKCSVLVLLIIATAFLAFPFY